MSINTSGDCRYALEALSSSCWSTEPCSCYDTPRYFKGSANCSSILFQPWKAPLGWSHPHHSVSQNYQKLGTDSIRLSTSLGYLWLTTGIPVGKPTGMKTCGSKSLVITGLRGSGCMFWVMRVLTTSTHETMVIY